MNAKVGIKFVFFHRRKKSIFDEVFIFKMFPEYIHIHVSGLTAGKVLPSHIL